MKNNEKGYKSRNVTDFLEISGLTFKYHASKIIKGKKLFLFPQKHHTK